MTLQWGHKQSLSLSTEESEKGQKGKRPRKTTNLSDTVFLRQVLHLCGSDTKWGCPS